MDVLLGPVICDDTICRIVSPVTSLQYGEEWAGEYWMPSSIPMHVIEVARPATRQHLADRRVPRSDWGALALDPDPEIDPALMLRALQLLTGAFGSAVSALVSTRDDRFGASDSMTQDSPHVR